jgi:hypothetical protein
MNPFCVWTADGTTIVDLTTMLDFKMVETEEKLVPCTVYTIVAHGCLEEYPLAYGLPKKAAEEYLEDIRIALNTNRRENDPRPTITKHHDIIADQDRNDIVFCLNSVMEMVENLVANDANQPTVWMSEELANTRKILTKLTDKSEEDSSCKEQL